MSDERRQRRRDAVARHRERQRLGIVCQRIECSEAGVRRCRARIAKGQLDRFTLVPGDTPPVSGRIASSKKIGARPPSTEHLRQRLQRFQWREAAE